MLRSVSKRNILEKRLSKQRDEFNATLGSLLFLARRLNDLDKHSFRCEDDKIKQRDLLISKLSSVNEQSKALREDMLKTLRELDRYGDTQLRGESKKGQRGRHRNKK